MSNITDVSWMFRGSQFNGDIRQWNTSQVTNMNWLFHGSEFRGDLRKWQLNDEQMKDIFDDTLPQYLAARRSIEEKAQLCATFTPPTTKLSNKKYYKAQLATRHKRSCLLVRRSIKFAMNDSISPSHKPIKRH
jgi:hypothetical protein